MFIDYYLNGVLEGKLLLSLFFYLCWRAHRIYAPRAPLSVNAPLPKDFYYLHLQAYVSFVTGPNWTKITTFVLELSAELGLYFKLFIPMKVMQML